MKSALPWTVADQATLAEHLESGIVLGAHDVDGACIYHYRLDNNERIAIALPGGNCIMISAPTPVIAGERRRPTGNT